MDADAIKRETELVRADWAARGRHWDRRSDEIAEQAARMNAPLIEAADIAPGQQVCDIATGAGEPALSVAALVGAEGRVFATDLCPEMMLGARRRAAAQGLGNITFRTADMLALPDADSAFDRVICRFGLMFCPDRLRTQPPRPGACSSRAGGRLIWSGGRARRRPCSSSSSPQRRPCWAPSIRWTTSTSPGRSRSALLARSPRRS